MTYNAAAMNQEIPAAFGAFTRTCAFFGAATGAVATAMGAVGSHWVAIHASEHFAAAFQTATAFALWHALALCVLSFAIHSQASARLLRVAALCWMAGILLFCGSLWLRGLGIDPRIVAIAPAGGSLLILGWVLTAVAVLRVPGRD